MPTRGGRYLVSAPDQPRVRRAGDLTNVLGGGLLLLWAVVSRERPGPLNRALAELVDRLPDWSLAPLSIVYSLGFVYSVVVVVLMAAGGRVHRDALRDVVVALGLAAMVGIALVRLFDGAWPYVVPEIAIVSPERQTPVFRIAITTALLVAASAHMVRPLRRVGWVIVALTVLAGSRLGFGLPSDATGAVGLGLIAAGTTYLSLGAPSGLPDRVTITHALDRLGVAVTDLRFPPSRSWGVRPVLATTTDGTTALVRVYGRDATDQQLLEKLWQSLWYRQQRRTFTFSRLQRVHNEALVLLWAARAGVPVPEVLAAGRADDEVALLALTTGGIRLDRLPPERLTDGLFEELWAHVGRLHRAGIAHGHLDVSSVRVVDDRLELHDLNARTISASAADRARDVVELLFSTAALLGAQRAVAAARAGFGDNALLGARPYLQLPALTATTRARADDPKALLRELTSALTTALEHEPPERVELRRISPRTLVFAVLGIAAALTIVPMIGGIDLGAVGAALTDVTWSWLLLAWVIGQAVFLTEATSMSFAVTTSVPFRPLVVLQIGAKFVGVATPGVTGTVAANAAFLSRFGVSPAVSLTQATMDSVAGILVEVVVLVVAFTFSDLDPGVGLAGTDLAVGRLGIILLAAVAAAVLVVVRIPQFRHPVVEVLTTMRQAAHGVVADPVRALGLLGGNLATRTVRALVLWIALIALDQQVGLAVALVVVIATGILQAVVPVPGGIGVSEAVMTGLLVVVGVPEAAAFAATIAYRLVVFYLPIAQGAVAMVWLTRRNYL